MKRREENVSGVWRKRCDPTVSFLSINSHTRRDCPRGTSGAIAKEGKQRARPISDLTVTACVTTIPRNWIRVPIYAAVRVLAQCQDLRGILRTKRKL